MRHKILDRVFDRVAELGPINDAGWKSLWRMSGGDRSKALDMALEVGKHYKRDGTPFTEDEFDDYIAEEFGGGCEIEWES